MHFNKIVAIGDSFTRGDELSDCPTDHSNWTIQQSKLTWPSLFAQSKQIEYSSRAWGGVGNQWISWRVISSAIPSQLAIINWTFFERFDYVNPDTDEWVHTHPHNKDKINHYFYRNIDSDIWNLYRNLQIIYSTICFLKQNNINFIMTCIDPQYNVSFNKLRARDNWIDVNHDGTQFLTWEKAITKLQQQVDSHIITFDSMTFLEWSKHKNFPIGPNGHPLEKAHTEAAKYINMVTTEGKINGH